jgi:RNA recognition motif-containing protein
MNLYVGNLAREITEEDLRQAFGAYGQVDTATIIKDKFTGESRGFAFVEIPIQTEAEAAIAGLNGKELKGRALTINEARPRTDRGRGGSSREKRNGGNRPR